MHRLFSSSSHIPAIPALNSSSSDSVESSSYALERMDFITVLMRPCIRLSASIYVSRGSCMTERLPSRILKLTIMMTSVFHDAASRPTTRKLTDSVSRVNAPASMSSVSSVVSVSSPVTTTLSSGGAVVTSDGVVVSISNGTSVSTDGR